MRIQPATDLSARVPVSFKGSFQFEIPRKGDTFKRLEAATTDWVNQTLREDFGLVSLSAYLEKSRMEAKYTVRADRENGQVVLKPERGSRLPVTVTIDTYPYRRRAPFTKSETSRTYLGDPGSEQIPVEMDPTRDAALLDRLKAILSDEVVIRYSPETLVGNHQRRTVRNTKELLEEIDWWRKQKAPKSWLERLFG